LGYGSVIDLVVSGGVGANEFGLPDLEGLSWMQAEQMLLELNLVAGLVQLPGNQDTAGARVVRSEPVAGSTVRAGESVDLWLEKSL
jgi:beta-lactam-binding protein with PASTA domain